ncbi:integrase catalytic domain-containing protein [Trichonephila clavipes]|uniref:Integrase catalytic domain-containing protein n=1 Tax=Trichonephila clavipes TaxID=2585209 RepID=A0A8X7BF56_TRICX|nr:integrase catalytic domain-containing protein [Trichonephila clavipes]
MSLNKLGKDELKIVAEELNLTVPEGAKIAGLKNLIVNSDAYKNDKELVQSAIDYALAEIKNKRLDSETKLEFERIKLAQLQKQLELANIQKNLIENSDIRNPSVFETADNNNVETLLKSVKTLTIPVPSRVESYNLFFQSLEKAFKIKEVPEQFKCEILLNILGERVNNLLVHVSEEELNNYSKLKDLVLKEFSPTPQECYNRFQKAQKLSSESYVQFASRLCATFEYYCQLRNVNDFKSLCELIVSDKIMNTLDRELMSYMNIKQGEKYFKPQELGRECDIYLSSKGKIKNEIFSKPLCENSKRFNYNKQNKFNAKIPRDASNVFFSELKNDKCVLCKNNVVHALQFCPQFKMFSVNERVEFVKNNRLCFKCFSPQCSVSRCRSKNCFCSKPHNKLLHYPRERKGNSFFPLQTMTDVNQEPRFAFSVNAESFVPKEDETQIVATACFKNKCLLSTALILVKDKYSEWQTFRALLDSGSETCLISNECANKLRLKTERINTLISCLNDASMVVNGCVKVAISNQNKSFERELDMLVVKKITDFIPQKALEINSDFYNFVELADSKFNVPGKIDLLLGANIFYELLKPERIKIKDSQLLLVNSVFGYIVTGNLDSINETKVHCGLIRDEDLNKNLEKFWKLEEIEEPIVKNKERLICEEHYANTHFRTKEGKYVVSMPLKKEPSCLGNSKDIALKRLGSLWNRLARDKII